MKKSNTHTQEMLIDDESERMMHHTQKKPGAACVKNRF